MIMKVKKKKLIQIITYNIGILSQKFFLYAYYNLFKINLKQSIDIHIKLLLKAYYFKRQKKKKKAIFRNG